VHLVTLHKSLEKNESWFLVGDADSHSETPGTKSLWLTCVVSMDVDMAGILRGRMESTEGGSVTSWIGMGRGIPSPSRPGGLCGSVVSSPAGSGAEPWPETDFGLVWRPQNAPFCTYMTKPGGGTICINVPHSKFLLNSTPKSKSTLWFSRAWLYAEGTHFFRQLTGAGLRIIIIIIITAFV